MTCRKGYQLESNSRMNSTVQLADVAAFPSRFVFLSFYVFKPALHYMLKRVQWTELAFLCLE